MTNVVELPLKMEDNLSATCSREPDPVKPSEGSCQRLTRSQANKLQKTVVQEIKPPVQPKNGLEKVEIEKIYLNKKVKVVHKNLETIYENPILKKGNFMLLKTSKVKRSIYLDREFRITSKQKSKLRKMKIKRLGKSVKPTKMTDEQFNNKMLMIEKYLNGSDQETEQETENCDIDISNCKENKTEIDSRNGNAQSSQTIDQNSCES